MAKVEVPLMSFDASGQIGKACVFFPWKGRHVVRRYVKPTNVRTPDQGNVRLYCKSCGYNNSFIETASPLYDQVKEKTPAGDIWNAFFSKTEMGAEMVAIKASIIAYATATSKADFDTEAASLGMVDQDVPYASVDPIPAGCVMFICARAAYDLGLAIAPVDAQDMSDVQVQAFKAAYSAT
jgi:hypothetical protein